MKGARALSVCAFAMAVAPSVHAAAKDPGVCIKLDEAGHVIDEKIADSSGDTEADQAALQVAAQLHWDKPYPKRGWVGIRIRVGPGASSDAALPPCEPTSAPVS